MRDATSGRRSSHRRKRAVTRDKPADGSQDRHGAIAILDAGDMEKQSDEVTGRVGTDVPLAALDLLASIETLEPRVMRLNNRLEGIIKRRRIRRLAGSGTSRVV